MGIKINNVISFTFAVGSFLAAIGSMMYFSNYTAVTPTVSAPPSACLRSPAVRAKR